MHDRNVLSRNFDGNFVKLMFLLKKLLKSWFDESNVKITFSQNVVFSPNRKGDNKILTPRGQILSRVAEGHKGKNLPTG